MYINFIELASYLITVSSTHPYYSNNNGERLLINPTQGDTVQEKQKAYQDFIISLEPELKEIFDSISNENNQGSKNANSKAKTHP